MVTATAPMADARTDRRIMVTVVLVLAVVIAVFTSVQSVVVLGVFSHALSGATPLPALELAVRIGVNVSVALALVLGVWFVRPERFRILGRIVAVIAIALAAALLRAALQVAVGVYVTVRSGLGPLMVEVAATSTVLALTQAVGLVFVTLWNRARAGERMQLAAQERSVHLLRQLQDEELRVRREIAETIHGSVQGVFVVLEAQLRHLAGALDAGDGSRTVNALGAAGATSTGEELRRIAGQLGALREGELRALSARLYPVDLARGADAAIRTLLARLPAWVDVRDDATDIIGPTASDLSLEARVVIVRVVEEAVTNALRHGGARTIRVHARTDASGLTVETHSDGASPAADATPSGLARLGRRAEVLGGSLQLAPGADGGATLRLHLPPTA